MKLSKANEKFIRTLFAKTFIKDIEVYGNVYLVGGCVRDMLLKKKKFKDIDMVVTGIPFQDLTLLLEMSGKVTVTTVHNTFGVIKFIPKRSKICYDIALPRTETKSGDGHTGFIVNSNPNLSIEDDLYRRDFTINSIAIDKDCNIVDPYYGMSDLNAKLIRMTNPYAFKDDPLRMLRAVQFASRFNFVIEPETYDIILKYSNTIKQITGERVKEEIDKIYYKGDIQYGVFLLKETGLLSDFLSYKKYDAVLLYDPYYHKVTYADFYYLLLKDSGKKSSELYIKKLKADIDTKKKIERLEYIFEKYDESLSISEMMFIFFKVFKMSNDVFISYILPSTLVHTKYLMESKPSIYPRYLRDLAINGNDLLGIVKDACIGKTLELLLKGIYEDRLNNVKEELLAEVSGINALC
jgi:tRNA nucleotidyltransferase/poly(A) polymerase